MTLACLGIDNNLITASHVDTIRVSHALHDIRVLRNILRFIGVGILNGPRYLHRQQTTFP